MNLQVVVNFEVIDESDDWIVVNKPAPLIVHPANRKPEPTLLGGLEKLLAYEVANGNRPAIVTRLDRETSGIVLVAKHTEAARQLGGIFERREAKKQYLAIVQGWPEVNEWECTAPILRAGDVGSSDIWVRQVVDPRGRKCLTKFRVECRFSREGRKHALVRCFPETGRMHQIRVHLAETGFPILGDKIYSREGAEYLEWMKTGWTTELAERLTLPRHALHAAVLEILWDGRPVRWHAELARDLTGFVNGDPLSNEPGVVIWNRDD